jgi:hypothetical protein
MGKLYYPDYSQRTFERREDPSELVAHYEARERLSRLPMRLTELPYSLVGDLNNEGIAHRYGLAQYCELYVFKNADSEVVYKNDSRSRLGVPIMMLPQIRRYHQFNSEDHTLLTAYIAYNAKEVLIPMFPEDQHQFLECRLAGQSEYLALAGYLHDIEKFFADTYRKYDRNEPWNHSGPFYRGEQLQGIWQNTELQDALGIDPNSSVRGSKRILINHILTGDANLPLGSVVPNIAPHIDISKLERILEVYQEIDEGIIGIWKNTRLSGVPRKGGVDNVIRNIIRKGYDPEELVIACMIAIADNIAQGIPPEHNSIFPAHQRINLYIATNLIYSALANE